MRVQIAEPGSRRMTQQAESHGTTASPVASRAILTILTGVMVGSLVCFGPMQHTLAQDSPGDRFGRCFSSSLSLETARSSTAAPIQASEVEATENRRRDCILVLTTGATASVDRWAGFEEEYGIDEAGPTVMNRLIQGAKYALDTICFCAQETARMAEFTYEIGDEPPACIGSRLADPLDSRLVFDRFGPAQLRSEITLHDPHTGKAFVGLTLTIPFGPGRRSPVLADRGRSPLSLGE
jgi:hypothetical protein